MAKVRAELAANGADFVVHETRGAGHATEIAAALCGAGQEASLIVIGGDGTIFEVVNGLDLGNRAAIGIIPAGTGNDVARMMNIPWDAADAARLILRGRSIDADAAQIAGGPRFVSFASYGIATEMVLGMMSMKKKTHLSYLQMMLKRVLSFQAKAVKLEVNGQEFSLLADFLSMHNCVCAGGGMQIAPGARLDDGRLDLVIVEYRGFWRRMANLIAIVTKRIHGQPNYRRIPCEAAKIHSLHENRCTIDGEIRLMNHLEIQILPKFVKFYI